MIWRLILIIMQECGKTMSSPTWSLEELPMIFAISIQYLAYYLLNIFHVLVKVDLN